MFTEESKKASRKRAEEVASYRIESIESLIGFSLLKISCDLIDRKVKYEVTKELEYIRDNEEIRKNLFEPEVTLDMEGYKITYEYEELNKDYLIAARNYHESLK